MSQNPDKFYSDTLSTNRLREAIMALPDVLRALLGGGTVIAHYGFGTNIHFDLQYLPMQVKVEWLTKFITDSIRQEIVEPGRCDFWFSVADGRATILFCHESDIHLGGLIMICSSDYAAHLSFREFGFGRGSRLKTRIIHRARKT